MNYIPIDNGFTHTATELLPVESDGLYHGRFCVCRPCLSKYRQALETRKISDLTVAEFRELMQGIICQSGLSKVAECVKYSALDGKPYIK